MNPRSNSSFSFFSFSAAWLQQPKARRCCQRIFLVLFLPAYFSATKRWSGACAASPLRCSRLFTLKAGLYVSLPALWTGLLVISVFLTLKIVTKIAGVFPLARLHYMRIKEASYTTLLMATGLTFGTISSLYGLQNGIINQNQYTILVSVVILSAFVPTLIAQKFFQPTVEMMHAWGRLYRKRMRVLSVEDMVDNGELEIGRSSR